MHVCTDWTTVYTLIRKSVRGMETEPMIIPRGKSALTEAEIRRTASPTHYQLSYFGPIRVPILKLLV